jgi:hypothetical protein
MTLPPFPVTETRLPAEPLDQGPYLRAYRGRLIGVMRWPQLDALWARVRADAAGGWHLYAVGEPPPGAPASAGQVQAFIEEVDRLLRAEHDEDYCGIVYADDLESPRFVKIYDPGNLGAVCGTSGVPTLPGWTLSKAPPVDLPEAFAPPANRRRWWRRLFGG